MGSQQSGEYKDWSCTAETTELCTHSGATNGECVVNGNDFDPNFVEKWDFNDRCNPGKPGADRISEIKIGYSNGFEDNATGTMYAPTWISINTAHMYWHECAYGKFVYKVPADAVNPNVYETYDPYEVLVKHKIRGRITDISTNRKVNPSNIQTDKENLVALEVETTEDTYQFAPPGNTWTPGFAAILSKVRDNVDTSSSPKKIEGPICSMEIAPLHGSLGSLRFTYCTEEDPNNFYGCPYPEIWTLASMITGAVFLLLLIALYFYAWGRRPIAQIVSVTPDPNPDGEKPMVCASHSAKWDDIEGLTIVILQ